MRDLDSLFFPKSIAVVGAKSNIAGGFGTNFLTALIRIGFPGKLYPVNPKAIEIDGLKSYPNVSSIPETPDFVIIGIQAPGVPQALRDCINAGVKNVHIFSSGFSETGEEEGRKLDEEITRIIRGSDLRVVGPNCMGIWVPASKLAGWAEEPEGSGSLAFLSQSGGHGFSIITHAQAIGVYFSKVISFGNARGLQTIDFLEYLKDDPDTKIISCYFEGMQNGNKVTQLIRQINHKKPVIVWKGGLTESGARAISSHTGSLAGEKMIWDAFFAQTGAIRVTSVEEMIDIVMLFSHLKPPRSRRALLFSGGGGNSVALADTCSREGLEVPRISEPTRKELNSFIRMAGSSVRNPLDIYGAQHDPNTFHRVMELAVADPMIDMVIIDRFIEDAENTERPGFAGNESRIDADIIEFAKKDAYDKPLVVALTVRARNPATAASAMRERERFAKAKIPVYSSFTNAAIALSRFISYYEFQSKEETQD